MEAEFFRPFLELFGDSFMNTSQTDGRPAVPTGTVPRPSQLRSDQPTLLQPWTRAEETELQNSIRRVSELESRRQLAENLAATKLNGLLDLDMVDARAIPGLLIRHADAIRDALAPFDSGVRGPGHD